MPANERNAEERLVSAVERGSIQDVEEALAAGANVNRSGMLARTPLMDAVLFDDVSIARLLVEKGADLEVGTLRDVRRGIVTEGMRAVHIATLSGPLDALQLLLQAGANPNSTDETGITPLMLACASQRARPVVIVQELLKGGADPIRPDDLGHVALHFAAIVDDVDVLDMLLSHAPNALNYPTIFGQTPLYGAADVGAEGAVSYLLSVGARLSPIVSDWEEAGPQIYNSSPLGVAVRKGRENVVRILLDVVEEVGGLPLIPSALSSALLYHQPRILRMLLAVQGEERRGYWARCSFKGGPMLHCAVGFGDIMGVCILLEAGADETAVDSLGRRPGDVVAGDVVGDFSCIKMKSVDEMAIYRALEQGPAFRAQSWAWPSRKDTTSTTNAAAAAAAAAAAGEVAPLANRASRIPLDVRVFRLNDRKALVMLISRYAQTP